MPEVVEQVQQHLILDMVVEEELEVIVLLGLVQVLYKLIV